MAKKDSSKKRGMDLPEDWEVVEEEPKKKKGKREFHVSNNLLWPLFIGIFLFFIVVALIGRSGPKETQTAYVNGIEITAYKDPEVAIKSLADMHVVGKTLNNLTDETDALQEIGAVVGKSSVRAYGSESVLLTGITDRTGIFIQPKSFRIEGKTKADLWKAVWTFTSVLSDTTIDSSLDWYGVQDMLRGFVNVSLVDDNGQTACEGRYGKIISAEGDVLSSLGFKQAELHFNLSQYQKSGDKCQTYQNTTFANVTCPTPGLWNFVITIRKGNSNLIRIRQNQIDLEYVSCDSVNQASVILRDLLYPNIVSSLVNVRMPTTI